MKRYDTNAERQKAYRQRKKQSKWDVSQQSIKLRFATDIPVLRYFGSKWRIAPWIIEHLPAHITYVEPFAGSASVLLRKHASDLEVLSDLNPDVINFWTVIRNHPTRFGALLTDWKYSQETYTRACNATREEPIERAMAFYAKNWMSFGSGTGKWKTGYRNPASVGVVDNYADPQKFIDAAERMADVTLLAQPAIDVIRQYDGPNTLFYVDPPYLHSTRNNAQGYSHEMTRQDHIDLLNVLRTCRGMVVLSGYPSELYRTTLREWTRLEKSTATRGTTRTEVLWSKPNVDLLTRLPLFCNVNFEGING